VELAERLFSTRRGALTVGVGAAVAAALLLFGYIRAYRHNVGATSASTPVLVARNLIQKGTPGATIGTQHLYQVSSVPKSAVAVGAYVDPASLRTGVAVADIYPGQQITAADFAPVSNTLDTQISGRQRALTFPIDGSRTLAGQLTSGDRIDIYYSAHSVHQILQGIPVLSGGDGTVTVRVTATQAALLALAVDSGRIWFTLRPRVGAPAQGLVTVGPDALGGSK
jgi:Flp pilus assembly protein CpaB